MLVKAGKGSWLTLREDSIEAKGKGALKTYWITPPSASSSTATSSSNGEAADVELQLASGSHRAVTSSPGGTTKNRVKRRKKASVPSDVDAKVAHEQRLVDWACDVLQKILIEVARERAASGNDQDPMNSMELERTIASKSTSKNPIFEVSETITMPVYDPTSTKRKMNNTNTEIELDPMILAQLRDYVATIAAMYNSNPFHNWDHAAHVMQSVSKLLNRIKTVDHLVDTNAEAAMEKQKNTKSNIEDMAGDIHAYTYGITSDPITQFAIVFSALIHDVDHLGVSNGQLIKENVPIASSYQNKSIAEQNSID